MLPREPERKSGAYRAIGPKQMILSVNFWQRARAQAVGQRMRGSALEAGEGEYRS